MSHPPSVGAEIATVGGVTSGGGGAPPPNLVRTVDQLSGSSPPSRHSAIPPTLWRRVTSSLAPTLQAFSNQTVCRVEPETYSNHGDSLAPSHITGTSN